MPRVVTSPSEPQSNATMAPSTYDNDGGVVGGAQQDLPTAPVSDSVESTGDS